MKPHVYNGLANSEEIRTAVAGVALKRCERRFRPAVDLLPMLEREARDRMAQGGIRKGTGRISDLGESREKAWLELCSPGRWLEIRACTDVSKGNGILSFRKCALTNANYDRIEYVGT